MKFQIKSLGGAVDAVGGPVVALVLVGVAGFYIYGKAKGGSGGFYQTIGEGAGGAVVDLVDGAVAGVAYGVGDKLGVPRTEKTACQKALDEGRTLDASFACPAGTFIKSFF